MPKTVILEYPDDAPYERIRDDIDTVLRGVGGIVASPTIKADAESAFGAALLKRVSEQGRPAETGTVGSEGPASNQALVESGVPFTAGGDTMKITIVDGVPTGWAVAPRLGGSAFGWCEETSSTNPVSTEAVDTLAGENSFIYFYAGYSSNNAVPVDSAGNILTAALSSFYVPYGTAFQARSYVSLAGQGAANHTVSFTKNDVLTGEVALALIVAKNTDTLADSDVTYRNSGEAIISGTVTVDRPALIISAWFGDGGGQTHTAVPEAGFDVVESLLSLPPNLAVQCAFAVMEVTEPGEYAVEWEATPVQGAILFTFALTNSTYPA